MKIKKGSVNMRTIEFIIHNDEVKENFHKIISNTILGGDEVLIGSNTIDISTVIDLNEDVISKGALVELKELYEKNFECKCEDEDDFFCDCNDDFRVRLEESWLLPQNSDKIGKYIGGEIHMYRYKEFDNDIYYIDNSFNETQYYNMVVETLNNINGIEVI